MVFCLHFWNRTVTMHRIWVFSCNLISSQGRIEPIYTANMLFTTNSTLGILALALQNLIHNFSALPIGYSWSHKTKLFIPTTIHHPPLTLLSLISTNNSHKNTSRLHKTFTATSLYKYKVQVEKSPLIVHFTF